MKIHYYPIILIVILVFQHHYSESVKVKRRKNETKNLSVSKPYYENVIHVQQTPNFMPVDNIYEDNGVKFTYYNSNGGSWDAAEVAGGGVSSAVKLTNSKNTKDFKALDAAGLVLAAKAIKFFLKGILLVAAKFPALLALPGLIALPAITSFYFLVGVLFGRLTAGLINPPMTTPATTTTLPTTTTTLPTTATTTTTTTTTPAPPGTTGGVNLFFGTNLSGNGAGLTAPIGTCVDFPPQVDNQIQSLQITMGTCIMVCDLAGCSGTCYQITGTTTVNDLGSFNMMMSSLVFC